MTIPTQASRPAGPGEDRRSPARALALAGCLAAAFAGCKTVEPNRPPDQTSHMPTTDGSPDNPFSSKTDFTREMNPDQKFNVHVELGRVYEAQGNIDAALAEYQKAVDVGEKKGGFLGSSELGPDKRALAERRMGGAYDRLGRFTQAEVHYKKALELAPKDAKVWNDVGYSYYLQNRLADAENALKTADGFDPSNSKVQTNLGLALAAAGKEEEALEALSRAGGPAVGHANLGFILAAMGRKDDAKAQYQRALALQPQLEAAREAIAMIDAPASADAIALAAAPTPAAVPSPSLPVVDPPIITEVEPASTTTAPKSDGLTRASAPAAARPMVPKRPAATRTTEPVKTSQVAPKLPATKSTDILENLPELPPGLVTDAGLKRVSGEVKASRPVKPGQPRRDDAVMKAGASRPKPTAGYRPRTNPIGSPSR